MALDLLDFGLKGFGAFWLRRLGISYLLRVEGGF